MPERRKKWGAHPRQKPKTLPACRSNFRRPAEKQTTTPQKPQLARSSPPEAQNPPAGW
jgi:hypothetical protein